jgi:hypothetical protein
MELAERWLDSQRATPSFVTAGTTYNEVATDILARPMPAGLGTPVAPKGRSMTPTPSNRYASPAVTRLTAPTATHDMLIDKGNLYKQRREALQERSIRKQMTALRSPRISEFAKQIPRSEAFFQRSEKMIASHKQQQAFAATQRARNDEKEEAQWFSPSISRRGKRATGRAMTATRDQNHKVANRREEQLEAVRTARVLQEMQEVRDTPDINARSQRLAAKRREKEGMGGMTHIEAMIERDRLARLARWERQQANSDAATRDANPKITMYAAGLERDGDVGDRLFEASLEAEERKAQMIRDKLARERTTPFVTNAAHRTRSMSAIEDDIMARHMSATEAKERAAYDEMARQKSRHTPAINPVSDVIAARMQQSTRERLYEPRATPQASTAEQSSFQPTTNNRSASAVSRSSSAVSFRERREEEDERRREVKADRMALLRRQREEREMSECTFRPTTHASSGHVDPGLDMLDRGQKWAMKREQKLAERRAQEHHDKAADCTFRPVTHAAPEGMRPPPIADAEDPLYGGDGTPWGTHEFLERQAEGRRIRTDNDDRRINTGSKWSNAPTVVQEFQLGSRAAPSIRALDRPIAPPSFAVPVVSPEHRRSPHVPSPQHFSRGAASASPMHFAGSAAPPASATAPLAGSSRIVPFGVQQHNALFPAQR